MKKRQHSFNILKAFFVRNIYLDAVNVTGCVMIGCVMIGCVMIGCVMIGCVMIGCVINRIWIYTSVNLHVTIRRFHTLMSVGQKKLLVCEKNVAAFSCCGKVL